MGIKQKRKLSESGRNDNVTSKVSKTTEETVEKKNQKSSSGVDFDIKHFRKELNSKSGQTVAMTQFLQMCKNNATDYLKLFLESGGNVNEILKQLNEENKKSSTVVVPVFKLLNLLLLKIQSSSPQLLQAAEETCRFFLNSYISTIEFMLSEKSNSKQQKITLKLLTTIVTLNSELAFSILNQLSLQPKTLVHLVKDKGEVRNSFIHFLMAYFVESNTSLIKAALDKQGLLSMIIPDLITDNSETVLMVLELMRKNILLNSNVSKTIKIKTFNHNVVLNLFNVFNWKDKVSKTGDEAVSMKNEVGDSIFNFLEILCTSHKHGIYFIDKSLGTCDVPTSQYLWKAIESLEAPWNNDKAGKLMITIVSKCPDLYRPVILLVERSFEPRNSEQWLKTVNFLKDLLVAMPAKDILNKMTDLSPVQVTNFVRNVYLPIPILKLCITSLISKDNALRNQVILLLNEMLSAVKSYLHILNSAENVQNKVLSSLRTRLEDFIPKNFPSTDLLISVLHSMLDNSIEDPSNKLPLPSKSRLLINVLDLLLLFNDILPNSLDPIATMLDSKRLFEKMDSIDKSERGELKLKITMFLIGADKFAFAPEKQLFNDILISMLDVYISSHGSVFSAARGVLFNILETTGIFDKSLPEIDLLLSVIHIVGCKFPSVIFNVVEVIQKVITNSGKFSDVTLSTLTANNNDNFDFNFDTFFSKLENSKFDYNFQVLQEKYIISPFIVGLLDNLGLVENDALKCLVNLFIVKLLHIQESPERLWDLLNNCKFDQSLKKYVFGWKTAPVSLNKHLFEKSSICYKLSHALLSEEELNVSKVFCRNDDESCTLDLVEPSLIFSWCNMIIFYLIQQSKQNTLTKVKKSNAISAFQHILSISRDEELYKNTSISMLEALFHNRVLLDNFTPFKHQSIAAAAFLTEFVLEIIEYLSVNQIYLSYIISLLSPYKHKLGLSLLEYIKECAERKIVMPASEKYDMSKTVSIIGLDFNDAKLIVREIVKVDLARMVSIGNEVSPLIHVLCYVIDVHTEKSQKLSNRIFQAITLLYSKIVTDAKFLINVTSFEICFYNYLLKNPECITSVPNSVFNSIFSVNHVYKSTSVLGSLLLRVNSKLLPIYYNNVVKDETLQKRELVLPLTSAAFNHLRFSSQQDMIQKIYDSYKSNIHKIIEKPQKSTQIYADNSELLVNLIKAVMPDSDCKGFLKKVFKHEVMEGFHIDLLEEVFNKTLQKCSNNDYINNYLLTILQLGNISLKKDPPQSDKNYKLYSCLNKFILLITDLKSKQNCFTPVRENSIWQNFFKSVLKYYLKTDQKDQDLVQSQTEDDCALLNVLSCLVMLLYSQDDPGVVDLFVMATSHSEFLNIMLSNRYSCVKAELVKLLFVLTCKNKNVMKPAHVPVYLSSYHASMQKVDRYILLLLKFYEQNGFSMTEYQPYIWGDSAATHYAVRSKRTKSSLWSSPTANHILNLLDKEMIERTVKYFPTFSKLNVNEDVINEPEYLFGFTQNKFSKLCTMYIDDLCVKHFMLDSDSNSNRVVTKQKVVECKTVFNNLLRNEAIKNSLVNVDGSELYDPAFLLPLLNYVVTPGSEVSCHRIVRGGILAVPLVALSSQCPMMRAAAFNVLHRFYTLLQTEMYYRNDKVLWSQFIDTLKCSLDSSAKLSNSEELNGSVIPRLPAVAALYLARSAIVMTHPLDPMFKPINNIVISKQFIDFSVVPDLLDLFHNSDIQFVDRRIWVLKLLRDGIKTFTDVKVLLKSVTFKIILDFYSCNFCDSKQKYLILEVLNSAICIPKAAKILLEGYGLFPWLNSSFRSFNVDNKNLISLAIHMISNLWSSLARDSFANICNKLNEDCESFSSTNMNKLFNFNDTTQTQIMVLLISLLNNLSGLGLCDVKRYLNVLRKISKKSLKTMTKVHMLNLVQVLSPVYDNSKVLENLSEVITNSKKDILWSSYTVLKMKAKDLGDKYEILLYLHDIIFIWL